MYVCMYVCIYIYIYVHLYICRQYLYHCSMTPDEPRGDAWMVGIRPDDGPTAMPSMELEYTRPRAKPRPVVCRIGVASNSFDSVKSFNNNSYIS